MPPPWRSRSRPVASRRDRREFIELPFRLHATAPALGPPAAARAPAVPQPALQRLLQARRRRSSSSPAATAASSGRISAQIDHAYNDFHGAALGLFGFFECEDDPEAADALLAAAEGWLRERGCDRMVGPMDFTMNDECGVADRGLRPRRR